MTSAASPSPRPSSTLLSLIQSIKKLLPGHSRPQPSNQQPNPSKSSFSSILKPADDNMSIASEDTVVGRESATDNGKTNPNSEWKQKLKDRLPKGYDAKRAVDSDRTRFFISPY